MNITFTKVQDAQPMGEYHKTELDQRKDQAPFKLVQVSPYVIHWKDGTKETINKRQLTKYQKLYPDWVADF